MLTSCASSTPATGANDGIGPAADGCVIGMSTMVPSRVFLRAGELVELGSAGSVKSTLAPPSPSGTLLSSLPGNRCTKDASSASPASSPGSSPEVASQLKHAALIASGRRSLRRGKGLGGSSSSEAALLAATVSVGSAERAVKRAHVEQLGCGSNRRATTCVDMWLSVSVPVLSVRMAAEPSVASSPRRAMACHELTCTPIAAYHTPWKEHASMTTCLSDMGTRVFS
mmetsp:Transcript_31150/g.72447  ORF Transcript_31150/g.72447 Transcript_31150/m.72447 type:complete len:227 (-) Transcript_31150:348-1028(-)